jgi:hypothetical protein
MSRGLGYFIRSGLLNVHAPDLGDICVSRNVVKKAFCTNCRPKNGRRIRSKLGVEKNVPVGAQDCPDCGYALYWDLRRV